MNANRLSQRFTAHASLAVLGQPVYRMDRAGLVNELTILHGLAAADRFRTMSTSRLRRELIAARCRYQRRVQTC